MTPVVVPNQSDAMVDKDGRPSQAWHAFAVALANLLKDHEARIVDAEASMADHETRITDLEP